MLPKKKTQTNKNKVQSPQNPEEGKSYQTGSTVLFPSSLTDTFPLHRLSRPCVSLLAFPSSGVCLVDVPQMFHIIWTTWGIDCEAFCKSFVTTIRYGLQSSSAETYLSSQASEWELSFKWSRRQQGKPTKSLIKSQWGPLSYILIETLW